MKLEEMRNLLQTRHDDARAYEALDKYLDDIFEVLEAVEFFIQEPESYDELERAFKRLMELK